MLLEFFPKNTKNCFIKKLVESIFFLHLNKKETNFKKMLNAKRKKI